ncbi:GtrA family protein [Leptotrichia sp. oral taxon 417]|jgi:gtrA family integral membrane protein|uniref:GtrA family protein n=1 Tax=Leptotrichia sp. oral taxon 417 TaxID=712365 RepID=UPI0015BBDEF0|nr:GtrA family protein [Leptotrichia sp. oral taxon 417]NWO26324.1 GtrA family protein [Leptotrichia sp. oral taxon 417]
MINLIKKLFYKYEKFIKFAIVGFGNLFISLVTYYLLVFFSINYQIANIGGFITGSLNGYIWNRVWVFKNSKKNLSSIVKFYLSYLSTWLLSAILLYIWIEVFNISDKIAPIINVVITTPINYLLNKYWVFKKIKKAYNEER